MNNKSDNLSKEKINSYLKEYKDEFNIIIFETIDSTNLYARKVISEIPDKTVIISEHQTAGRGRLGRDFHSPANNGIYMSVIFKKMSLPKDITLLTVATATAVSRAIENTLDIKTDIKWVNDIFVKNKKVCGILTEMAGEDVVIGIGVNLKSADEFPQELKDIAGALGVNTFVRNELIASILTELQKSIITDKLDESFEYYKSKSLVLNKTITFEKNGKTITALVTDINEKGNLIVKTEAGEVHIIHSGEIRISLKDLI